MCINELLIEMPGKDSTREYLELRGPPGGVIPANTYLITVEGDKNQNPGRILTSIRLDGLAFGASDASNPNGYLVILPFNNAYAPQINPAATRLVSTATGFSGLPDGRWSSIGSPNYDRSTVSFFLATSATAPVMGLDIDTDNDGVPESDPEVLWSVIDSISSSDHPLDRTYARINFRNSGTSSVGATATVGFRTGYYGRLGDSFGSTAQAWVIGAAVTGSYPNWVLAGSFPSTLSGKPLNHIGSINAWANVAPVNTVPAAQTTNEDIDLTLTGVARVSVSDVDAGTGSLVVTLTATNGTVTLQTTSGVVITGNGTSTVTATGAQSDLNSALNGLRFSPTPGYSGIAGITIDTNDQGNTGTTGPLSDVDTLSISILPVNDAPVFSAGPDQQVNEDAGPQTVTGWATGIDDGDSDFTQALTFAVTANSNPGLFSATPTIAPDGTLQYTPADDVSGSAIITVQLSDDGGVANGGINISTPQAFSITVRPVNDAPTFAAGPEQSAPANSGPVTVDPWATQLSAGPANESGQSLTFAVTGNDNPGIFAAGPAISPSGALSFTPSASTPGVATITLVLMDDGGTANGGVNTSDSQIFTVTVTPDVTVPTLGSAGIDDGDADDLVDVGAVLNYTVTFSEPMDSATIGSGDFINSGTATIAVGVVTVTGNVAAFQVTATAGGSLTLRITGEIRDPSGNLLAVPVTDDTTVTVLGADTTTTITGDNPDPTVPGQSYSVAVSVTSTSGVPTGSVQVSDDQGASCNFVLANGSGACNLTSTVLGARTLTANYVPDNGNFVASSDTDTHQVHRPANLVATKTNNDTFVERGDPVLYTITVTNSGPEGLVGVRIQDILPVALVNGMWSCVAGAGATCPVPSAATGDIDVLVNLPLASVVTFSVAADVSQSAPSGFLVNEVSATVPAGFLDVDPADNVAIDVDELHGIFKDGFEP